MSETTIFHEWQAYDRDVVPTDAPAIQREECRRAFYAGAMAGYSLTFDAASAEPEDEAHRRLFALESEIVGVLQDLRIAVRRP